MANSTSALQSQSILEAGSELHISSWAQEKWAQGHQKKVACLLLLKAFHCNRARTLTLAELSQVMTPDNVPLMMLSVGWSALLRVGTDWDNTMDPWHLRDEYRGIIIHSRCDSDIYHQFEELCEAKWFKARHDKSMTADEKKAWRAQWTGQQAAVVENHIQVRLGLNTTSQSNAAVVQEAQKIGQKVLEYVTNGVVNPFALDEIRTMFQDGSTAGKFEMSRMRDILEEMSESIADPFVFDQFKSVLLETVRPLTIGEGKREPQEFERQ
jgi:hypothetical protein